MRDYEVKCSLGLLLGYCITADSKADAIRKMEDKMKTMTIQQKKEWVLGQIEEYIDAVGEDAETFAQLVAPTGDAYRI